MSLHEEGGAQVLYVTACTAHHLTLGPVRYKVLSCGSVVDDGAYTPGIYGYNIPRFSIQGMFFFIIIGIFTVLKTALHR